MAPIHSVGGDEEEPTMSLFALLGTLAEIALSVLALAAGTMLVLGLAVAAIVWLSGSRPTRQPRRS